MRLVSPLVKVAGQTPGMKDGTPQLPPSFLYRERALALLAIGRDARRSRGEGGSAANSCEGGGDGEPVAPEPARAAMLSFLNQVAVDRLCAVC